MTKPIAFIDLAAQRDRLRGRIDAAVARVLDHGAFIMGPEVERLEEALSAFGEMDETVSCSSGTDALILPLMSWGVGPGDAVFVPGFTFAATAEVVALLGATPVFVDVLPDTFNLDAQSLAAAIAETRAGGRLTPRAVIAVDLFGQPAEYPAIRAVCDDSGLRLIADAAQGFGATLHGRKAGYWADAVATSFFPAKPLGCYGDGGAVQTNDRALAARMRSLRVHGQGDNKYDNVMVGLNARLDTIQAAVLLEKLAVFPEEVGMRNRIAARYGERLRDFVDTPAVAERAVSSWAQYTVQLRDADRQLFVSEMKRRGVPTAIYYPKPLHKQEAYRTYPVAGGRLKVAEKLAERVISLPMHAYLREDEQDRVVAAIGESLQVTRRAA